MTKCLNARPKTKEKGIDIILMYIEVEKQDVVQVSRKFIKGCTQGKLTACEHEFARLFLALGFQHNCTCKEHVH